MRDHGHRERSAIRRPVGYRRPSTLLRVDRVIAGRRDGLAFEAGVLEPGGLRLLDLDECFLGTIPEGGAGHEVRDVGYIAAGASCT